MYLGGALLNHLMFLFISVPMAERNMAKYKTNFEQYKKEVRMFLPIKKA
jgi:steroid 5-alpha reductase family enzyme